MQVPIIESMYSDESGDLRTAYPVNLVPVPKESGFSAGYLRPADGMLLSGTGPGVDRGAENWKGELYRVMGSSLVKIAADGTLTELGNIGGIGQVTMDYSFDDLIIAGGGKLYYWSGSTLTQVTDPDLGNVIDMLWVDGYTMTTDGEFLIVNDLNDKLAINPLRYGSSEVDPDPIKGLFKLHNEVYALNRYTIEVFNNSGTTVGNFFPFQRVPGALITRGVVGTYAATTYTVGETDVIAFLGNGRKESPSVWVGINASSSKIATREIDTLIQKYTEDQLADVVMESRLNRGHYHLYIHLPDETIVYDAKASEVLQKPVWFILRSSIVGPAAYRARNIVWCYNAWHIGDPTSKNYGTLTDATGEHFGQVIGWEFGTPILYNASMGAIINEMELVCLPGRVKLGADPTVWTSYSEDGETWSQEKPHPAGKIGDRARRLRWPRNGRMANFRIQKFRGTSDAHLSFPRLEVQLEPLNA